MDVSFVSVVSNEVISVVTLVDGAVVAFFVSSVTPAIVGSAGAVDIGLDGSLLSSVSAMVVT